MSVPAKKLFLIDSIGALLSAFLLGMVLANFENAFGIPKNVFYSLSAIACLFLLYSSTCFLFLKENWKPYLTIIAIGNLFYCCLTIGMLLYFYRTVTVLAWIYFIGEVTIIVALATLELKTASALGAAKPRS